MEQDGKKQKIAVTEENGVFKCVFEKLIFSYTFEETPNYLAVKMGIENIGDDFKHKISFGLGIDSYMTHYPQWKEKFFPTLLQCEKTHLWGYYMNTSENAVAIVTDNAVVSYDFNYNIFYEDNYPNNGHRILGTELVLFDNMSVSRKENQCQKYLRGNSVYNNTVFYLPVKEKNEIKKAVSDNFGIPTVDAPKYTLEHGEKLKFTVNSNSEFETLIFSPSGENVQNGVTLKEYGTYKLIIKNKNGKECEAVFCVRKPWDYYLKAASENAFLKPQKATTHVEGFYGLFSAFLYSKHTKDKETEKRHFQHIII